MLSTLANWMRRLEMTVDCYVFGRGWLKADLNHNLEETMMMRRGGLLDSLMLDYLAPSSPWGGGMWAGHGSSPCLFDCCVTVEA